MHSHRVQFYDSDAFLVRAVREFIEPARQRGDGVLVIATREHLTALRAAWGAAPGPLRCDGPDHCVYFDAHETLATFMVDGWPDEQRFLDVVGGLIRQVSANGSRQVSAFGEMIAVLCADGNFDAALRLEQLWEDLLRVHQFSLLCAYPLSAFPDDGHRRVFQCICAAHAHVNPIESLSADPDEPEQLHRMIALLQQRANALDTETRRRHEAEREVAAQRLRIAAMAAAQAELESLAGQDALTGLSNRRVFSDRLAHAVERATRTGRPLALIYIDLDEFKALNDNHGHAAGDQLLRDVAARLRLCVRTVDTVCRWGGDEFAVIAEDANADEAGVLMQRIVAALGTAYVVGGASIEVSASAGLSRYPQDAADAPALVRSADAAMYLAKRAGRSATPGHATPDQPRRAPARGAGAPAFLTVEAAAAQLLLSRPHVLKMIAEQRFHNVVWPRGGAVLIPVHEVRRVAQEMRV
jgi:diguanylate cyclase (GGDEF)-like protein